MHDVIVVNMFFSMCVVRCFFPVKKSCKFTKKSQHYLLQTQKKCQVDVLVNKKCYLCGKEYGMISKNKIKYIKSLELKKNRKSERLFVAEGRKLVGDLLPVYDCAYLAATREWLDSNAEILTRIKVQEIDEVTDDELRRASFVETPQQVLALFRQPQYEVAMSDVAASNLCLALDGVQNPGNLGTIVRLADWFGIEHIFCSRECADIYNPKTVQATMGGITRVKVHYVDLAEEIKKTIDTNADIPVYGTFLDGENFYEKSLTQHGLIVMGNEGKGISADIAKLVSERLYIPNYPADRATSESLNVAIATAVICSEFRRRSTKTDL